MIDSVALVWGHAIGTAERRARGKAEPLAPPVRLDLDRLGSKLGNTDGEITEKNWGDGGPTRYGQWKHGRLDVLYRPGRLELRASLPKLLLDRNDVVLDERGVHDGLRELVRVGEELIDGTGSNGYPSSPELTLREADPARLDYCYQWVVPSVAFTLETIKSSIAPSRAQRDEIVSPKGGRTLNFGKGGKRMIRFYDKVGEMRARREEIPPDVELDTLLRYEIQERRRPRLRLVHEDGYCAASVRRELQHGLGALDAIVLHDLDAILATYGDFRYAVPFTLTSLYLVEHDEAWPWVKKHVSDSAFYRWRDRARLAARTVGELRLEIPSNAFDSRSPLWSIESQAA
jgi:hypothetical protein